MQREFVMSGNRYNVSDVHQERHATRHINTSLLPLPLPLSLTQDLAASLSYYKYASVYISSL